MCVCLYACIYVWTYLPTLPHARSIFKQGLTGLNSEFSISKTGCLTKSKELQLPYNLPITVVRIIEFITFPRALVLCDMQLTSSRI